MYDCKFSVTSMLLLEGASKAPFTIHDLERRVSLVYLQTGMAPYVFAKQIGHECFHRWCTPTLAHHWVQEMMAEVFAVDFLQHVGEGEYAGNVLTHAQTVAPALPVANFVQVTSLPYPPGMYDPR